MWSGDELDLAAYLARIGYEGPVGDDGELKADLPTLYAVHRAHTAAITFESLDVLLGRPVELEVKALQDKLVHGRRGGYCYEQNSLLAAALERIGFEVSGRGARNRTRGDSLLAVTHAVLVVTVDGEPWLCDAGFGAMGPCEPVPLARPGVEVRQGEWTYTIREEDGGVHALCLLREGTWRDLYAFSPQHYNPVDYVVLNHYSSSHPRSAFVGQVIVQRPGDAVRLALVGRELTRVYPDGRVERRPVAPDELPSLLAREFGLRLSERDAGELVRLNRAED
ncbi:MULTISPECIES: arylamine N-acetyltransferase [unclassified Streptomyces]|uniref:arylamine N-acetyltransferase family protein n=1 Tax=unclassified Streptomyces TaxID=2593676 RepID=UPI00224DA746|nr:MULTISPECIES: arylamine N-acetyltransferase [unclassified Streptomyces]MCX4528522.1 arylamine N-acetyltransferase [Streptomyces sp. NBC_01551]MCX4540880.1 arylamine N-acetyltransferase [Streptomyces sp. NBC_01565]